MKVKKADRIVGKNLTFRNACVADAEFIYSLRKDEEKSRHLSKITDGVDAQVKWLESYAVKADEAYFIIESSEVGGAPLGTVRLYDAQGDSFCWGSWVLVSGAPSNAAIESALIVYEYAVKHLGFKKAHFQVHSQNEGVWKFHERFGAMRLAEDAGQIHYSLAYEDIVSSIARYRRYLNNGIIIQEYSN